MFALRRTAIRSLSRSTSTYAAPEAHTAHDAYAAAPVQHEGFGKGFYLSIAATVGVLALYKFDTESNPDSASFLTRLIEKYHSRTEMWEARNALHTHMVERAAEDRSLFQDSKKTSVVGIKFPEALNMGSPWNQVTGWSSGDLSAVKAHLEAQRERHTTSLQK